MRRLHLLCIGVLAMAGIGMAQLLGPVSGTVWQNIPTATDSTNTGNMGSSLPSATFTSTEIDYCSDPTQFPSGCPATGGYNPAAFLNFPTFSNQVHGFNSGANLDNTEVQLTGTIVLEAGANNFELYHDDGAAITITGPDGVTCSTQSGSYCFNHQTASVDSFTVTAAATGVYSFVIVYAECCGAPAGLVWANAAGVPLGPVTSYEVRYTANLQFGESYIDLINDGANGAPLSGPGIGATVGNICVNVYAFDPNEEMISCCSCLVTPDQVTNLGVNRDITSNTATGVVPTSVTIKLVATLAGTGGSGTSCTGSAAGVAAGLQVPGLEAFGTTLHATPTAGSYATAETPFVSATLGAAELSSLANRCTNIVGNLSGFGICASCRKGALGAASM